METKRTKAVDKAEKMCFSVGVTATTESTAKPSGFSHHGYFEEFISCQYETPKVLGVLRYDLTLPPEQVGRLLGVAGIRERTLTENTTFIKGHRTVVVKASAKKPIKVRTMLQKLEGR